MERNPKRIPGIVKELTKIWKKYPQLRLGQLLYNAVYFMQQDFDNLYYMEDNKLIEFLQDYDQKMEKDRNGK